MTIFYPDMESLSKYSPVMLQLSPAARILNENPVEALIQSRLHALFILLLSIYEFRFIPCHVFFGISDMFLKIFVEMHFFT